MHNFPLYLDSAAGAHLTDVDGHTYADFALADTGGDGWACAASGAAQQSAMMASQKSLGVCGGWQLLETRVSAVILILFIFLLLDPYP